MDGFVLFDYWRSSAAYRVRIALNLLGHEYESRSIHLVKEGGKQNHPDYLALNPEGRVPALVHGSVTLTQSLAIVEYLHEITEGSDLLSDDPVTRAWERALAQLVAADMHPLNNLSVLQYLKQSFDTDQDGVDAWYKHWIARGFAAFEAHLTKSQRPGRYCRGSEPGLADICLIPQVYNAERFNCDLEPYPQLRSIVANCADHPAFAAAAPEMQADATPG